ncbi:DUF3131 domain-containing protein [Hyalangium versicolor]|uniref:DUF3131 domain-containing protein n=1 Tax=Hyalangium versicolor TaxID=2861190 RepID=UPI001CCE6686|nr:DUF3131 domain-containing protein [Hyalangium versicolor]
MRHSRGFLAARSHAAFLIGLSLALGTIFILHARAPTVRPGVVDYGALLGDRPGDAPLRATGVPLSDQERTWARIAWTYFENNYQAGTGLVNSVDGYPSTTLWDLGSYMMALLAAEDLGLVDEPQFDARMDKLLASLETLPLVNGQLPNKVYHTVTLAMVDYNNNASAQGVGWSALDVARFAMPATLITWRHPRYTPRVRSILLAWGLGEMAKDGQMMGSHRSQESGALELRQEGRFGYEQYGAKSLFLLGLDVSRAVRYEVGVDVMKVGGQLIAYDSRLPEQNGGTQNAVLSEPYVLEGLEFGLNSITLPLARSVYHAQQGRFEDTGILTAVSEDNIDRPPYFVYNSVLNGRHEWAAFTPEGVDASAHRCLSLKAAFGWAYLFDSDYSHRLLQAVSSLNDPTKGWYSGRYEADGKVNTALTANTNALVLEALWYRAHGPLLSAARRVQ